MLMSRFDVELEAGVRALRRVLTIVLTTGLLAAPLAVAQQAVKIPRIGLLGAASASGYASQLEAFRQGLRALGYVEGQNIIIDYRWAEGRYERLSDLAAELVRLKVDVILTHGTPGTQAAKRATTTIPIVVVVAGDAVATGLVKSLARPGGNVTGSSFFLPELSAKRLELLREVLPEASRIGVLLNAGNAVHGLVRRGLDSGARAMKVELQYVAARGPSDLDRAFDALTAGRNQGLVVVDDGMLIANAGRIADPETAADDRVQRACGSGRAHVLRRELPRSLATGPDVRGQDPEGRETERAPDRAGLAVRVEGQPQRVGDIMLTSLCLRIYERQLSLR
jgi:putative ABC transport system substrate-binding protein